MGFVGWVSGGVDPGGRTGGVRQGGTRGLWDRFRGVAYGRIGRACVPGTQEEGPVASSRPRTRGPAPRVSPVTPHQRPRTDTPETRTRPRPIPSTRPRPRPQTQLPGNTIQPSETPRTDPCEPRETPSALPPRDTTLPRPNPTILHPELITLDPGTDDWEPRRTAWGLLRSILFPSLHRRLSCGPLRAVVEWMSCEGWVRVARVSGVDRLGSA